MTAGLVLTLQLAALAALALSMQPHHRAVLGLPASPLRARLWQTGGWAALAISAGAAVQAEAGVGVGLTLWFGMATMAALAVAMALTGWSSLRR